jgi:hypothetical protein
MQNLRNRCIIISNGYGPKTKPSSLPIPWSDPLTSPIALRDGRELVTLRDAAEFFVGFGAGQQAHDWNSYAVELLMKAAETGDAGAIVSATDQVQRALFREGMV